MLKENKLGEKHSAGFTIIELLVVLTIIGILTVIGLSLIYGAREKARDARRFADLQQIRLGLALYASGTEDIFPQPVNNPGADTSIDALAGSIFSDTSNPLLVYMGYVPKDPVNSAARVLYYTYDTNGNNTKYVLCGHLESSTQNWIIWYEDAYGGEQPACPSV